MIRPCISLLDHDMMVVNDTKRQLDMSEPSEGESEAALSGV